MDSSDLGSKGLSTPTFLSCKRHVSSLEVNICSRPFRFEAVLDRFEEGLNLMNLEGIDSLRGIMGQLRRDHCRVKLLAVAQFLCTFSFSWRSCSIFSDSRYLNEFIHLLIPFEPVVGVI